MKSKKQNNTQDNIKKFRAESKATTEALVRSLNMGVKLDHIDFVEHGLRPIDDDYRKFKKEMLKSLGRKEYKKQMKHREEFAVEGYKSKRIINML